MKPAKWTEREFFFGYDSSYAPFFLERLRGSAPRMEELTSNCAEEFAAQGYENGWSIKEHIGHLTDLEHLHDGRIDDFINGLETLRPADMQNKATYDAGHNGKTIKQLIREFRESRDAYLKRLEELDEQYLDARSLHPRLKQIVTLTDLLHFVAEHDNNHLTKIAAIVRCK